MNGLARISCVRRLAEATPSSTLVAPLLLLLGLGGCADTPPVSPVPDPSPSEGLSYQDLLGAEDYPGHWLTYSGSYRSNRYSRLEQVDTTNVDRLRLRWVFQMTTPEKVETTPLVVNETMYLTGPPNDVFALDTRTGRPFWSYEHRLPERISVCCGQVNRGLALLEGRLFMGTLDAHLVALDAKTGAVAWETEVADFLQGYAITVAPLALKDKIIMGISGGEYGIRGFLDAYDPKTGERLWRFNTIPGPGEPGNESWEGDSWKTGGAPTWITGSFDPELNLLYWGTGNPSPDWNGDVRKGDNLYSSSVVALDADTGELKWYFQFTPHDVHDWDAVQIPVLVDSEFGGKQRRLMLWGNRNGFFYVLDRESGEFLLAKAFAKQTWAEKIDETGRPVRRPNTAPTEEGTLVYPGVQGATNWFSPSYSPKTGLFYVSVWELANLYYKGEADYSPGSPFWGGLIQGAGGEPGWGAIRALVPQTGELAWEYRLHTVPWSGVLTTAGDLAFGGTSDGQFFALDARTGDELWVAHLGGTIGSNPITYLTEGKQQMAISAGSALFTFELE